MSAYLFNQSASGGKVNSMDSETGQAHVSGALSVSAAVALAKGALEAVVVHLVGEVSQVSCKPGYKAAYFTLKDKSAALPCMMWNNRYDAAGVKLTVGQLVEVRGRFTLFAPKGRMNFDVFTLALAGEGRLRQEVAALARKLEAEGLMAPQRKRALPFLPAVVGLVTSPRGAAIHDVLRTLRRRFPLARILVAGVAVEGRDAAQLIGTGIQCVCEAGAEVVLVVRGGGSYEDLMPFNDETLARIIAACQVPIITGIGHEPDTSIADMVADVRASTPTAAAEAVTPDSEELKGRYFDVARTLTRCVNHQIERQSAVLEHIACRPLFVETTKLFSVEAQTLDYFSERLSRVLALGINQNKQHFDQLSARIKVALPRALERDTAVLGTLQKRLVRVLEEPFLTETQLSTLLAERFAMGGRTLVPQFSSQLRLMGARLHDLSPLGILARGYAIARTEAGRVIKSVAQAPPASLIKLSVSDGQLSCLVQESETGQISEQGETKEI